MLVISILTIAGLITCNKSTVPDIGENIIMQVDSIPYRSSIFERRYGLGNKKTVVTEDEIQNYLETKIKEELLFVKAAYEAGIHNDKSLQNSLHRYNMEVLEKAHPIHRDKMQINQNAVRTFYENFKNLYTFGVLNTRSYQTAMELKKQYEEGTLNLEQYSIDLENTKGPTFPSYNLFKKIEFSKSLPPQIFEKIIDLEENKISNPIQLGGLWGLVILNKKVINKKIKPFEKVGNIYANRAANFYRYKVLASHQQTLKKKFELKELDFDKNLIIKLFDSASASFKFSKKTEEFKIFECKKFTITNKDLMTFYNNINAYTTTKPLILVEKDLNIVSERVLNQQLMYYDALSIGVQNNPFVADQIINKKQIELRNRYIRNHLGRLSRKLSEEEIQKYYFENKSKYPGEYSAMRKNVHDDLYLHKIELKKELVLSKLEKESTILYNKKEISRFAKHFSNN